MNFVVVGGGTAGWLSALFLKRSMPHADVSVIYSSKIGVIGVGEGTVPAFISFLDRIGISAQELIASCGATLKLGIRFENWNGDGRDYFHSFDENIYDFMVPNVFSHNSRDYYIKSVIGQGLPLDEYTYAAELARNNKVDGDNALSALHFDAARTIGFLQKKASERGIKYVDSVVNDVVINIDGYATELIIEGGKRVPCDFVVDSTGQQRSILGKFYDVKWESKREELPMNRALPFWLESEDSTRPYTRSIAMRSGWMWQIPVEGRIGAGCVFNDSYSTPEEVVYEAEKMLGKKIEVRKDIPFEAGESEKFWVKNVMSIGLSSAFVEPLEATSIWVTTEQLNFFAHFLPECSRPRESSLKVFNQTMKDTMESIRSFIYFHYMTKRKDSDFWREFRKEASMPKSLKRILHEEKLEDVNWAQLEKGLCRFSVSSYLAVGSGVGIISNMPYFPNVYPSAEEYKKEIEYRASVAKSHDDFLREVNLYYQVMQSQQSIL